MAPFDRSGTDGTPLLLQYAFGMNPELNNAGKMPALKIKDGNMEMPFYSAAKGVTYWVESSNDLTHWNHAGVTIGAPDESGVSLASKPKTDDSAFFRISTSLHGHANPKEVRNVLLVYITSTDPTDNTPYYGPYEQMLINGEFNVRTAFSLSTYGIVDLRLGGSKHYNLGISSKGMIVGQAAGYAESSLINDEGYQVVNDGKYTRLKRPSSHPDGEMIFSHVAYLTPKNTAFAPPYARLFHYRSVYQYSSYGGNLAHEMGHNLGAGHAGTPTDAYGDWTCLLGNSTLYPDKLLNVSARFQIGAFAPFPGSHVIPSADGGFKLYPLAEMPEKAADGQHQLKAIEIPITDPTVLAQTAANLSKPGFTAFNVRIRYFLSYLKDYSLVDMTNVVGVEKDLAKYTYVQGFDRCVLIHKLLEYDYNNGQIGSTSQSYRLGSLMNDNDTYTISEGAHHVIVTLKSRSTDASYRKDYAVLEVDLNT